MYCIRHIFRGVFIFASRVLVANLTTRENIYLRSGRMNATCVLLLDREFNHSRKCLEVPIREKIRLAKYIAYTVLHYTRCPPKSGTLNFRYFDIKKYSIFGYDQIKHCLLKRMITISFDLILQPFFKHNNSQNLFSLRELFTTVHSSP